MDITLDIFFSKILRKFIKDKAKRERVKILNFPCGEMTEVSKASFSYY